MGETKAKGRVVRAGPAGLTPRQREVLAFVRRHIERDGYPPSIREIGNALGIRSPNGVACHLRALKEKGYLDRSDRAVGRTGQARSITLPGVTAGGFSLPLLGVVAAGPTVEAVEQDERLDLKELFGADGLYAVHARGDGMAAENVADGDYLVLREPGERDSGRTVAASVAGAVGLYSYLPRPGEVRLQPRAPGGSPAVARPGADDVRVLGVLVGVLRKG